MSKPLDAFMAKKAEIDAALERLTILSADHFEVDPDEVHWGHVGTLTKVSSDLAAVCEFLNIKKE